MFCDTATAKDPYITSTRCRQFKIKPRTQKDIWQTETQKVKSAIDTPQRDIACPSDCANMFLPDGRDTQQFAVIMHNLRVYLKINKTTTLLMLPRVNYLLTSLLDHFVMAIKTTFIRKQKRSFCNVL